MKMSFLGQAILALTSYAIIVLMGAILVRAIQIEKLRQARAQDQEMEHVRIPLPAGPRRFPNPP